MGQAFFSGVGCIPCDGVAEGDGVSAGLGDGVSSGVTVGDEDGVGDACLRFDFAFGVTMGDGVGETLFSLGVAVGDGVGEAFFGFGEAVGGGLGVLFFVARLRCFRGVGVGVGSKTLLIFVPNDSSAALAVGIAVKQTATNKRLRKIILVAANKINGRAFGEWLC